MNFDRRSPCTSCPYRKDAPLHLWDLAEFESLLANDRNEMTGAVYQCHEGRKQPDEERRPCMGWMLDQKRRNVPSIQLRMLLMRNAEACAAFNEAHAGAKLFASIAAMCRANGVRR